MTCLLIPLTISFAEWRLKIYQFFPSSNTGLLEILKYGFAFLPPIALTSHEFLLWHSLWKMLLPRPSRGTRNSIRISQECPPETCRYTFSGSLQVPCQHPAHIRLDLEDPTCWWERGLQLLDHIRPRERTVVCHYQHRVSVIMSVL